MKIITALLVALCLSLCPSCLSSTAPPLNQPHEYSVNPIVKSAFDATQTVFIQTTEGKIRPIGAAVITRCEAGKTMLAFTAYHVAKAVLEGDNPPPPLRWNPSSVFLVGSQKYKQMHTLKMVAKDEKQDIALLAGFAPERSDCPAAPLSVEYPSIGDTVYVIGAPMGVEKNVTKGILSQALWDPDDKVLYYQSDAAVFFGNSGGGMFNTRGELIGTVVQLAIHGFTIVPGSGKATALPHLKALLASID